MTKSRCGYIKNARKNSWSKDGQAVQTVAKARLIRNKLMLSIRWDCKGIIHCELLPRAKPPIQISTVNTWWYLSKKFRKSCQNRPIEKVNITSFLLANIGCYLGKVWSFVNARSHGFSHSKNVERDWLVSLNVNQKINLITDFPPSDFHLFRSLQILWVV